MSETGSKRSESTLKIIDLLMRASQHNTSLAWQGVNRTLAIAASALAIATLLYRIGIDPTMFLVFSIMLSISVSLCMQLISQTITRNSEHVFKYNLAVRELENRACDDLSKEQIKYLPNHVYEKILKGSKTEKHNKRVLKIIPWCIRLVSNIATGLCAFKIQRFLGSNAITSVLFSIIIVFPVSDPFLGIISDKLLEWLYRDEVENWKHEFDDSHDS